MRFLMVVLLSVGMASAAVSEENRRITVTGYGQIEAVPDVATLTLGATTTHKSAQTAMRENALKVEALLAVLAANGIEDRDIQTNNLSLHPQYDHRSNSSQGPQLTGYMATNTVAVRARDLDVLGTLLDQVLESGANQFHGLSFGLSEPQPYQDEARIEAVEDARRKAELYATAAGVVLGEVVTISESVQMPGRPMMMEDMAMARSAAAVPIAAGEVATSATITIVYELTSE